MMLSFKLATTEEDLNLISKFKMELMQYHVEFAIAEGINDEELFNYSREKSLSTVPQRESYLLFRNDCPVGMAQVEEQISSVDHEPILFVHGIYIQPSARNGSIGGSFLRYLCKKYKKRIECECWYDIPAAKLYERAGFRPLVTRYMLPLTSRFYGSDQN